MSLTSSAPVLRGMLTVQNHEPNSTVFSKTLNGDPFRVTFAAKGYPGDRQRVPAALADDIDFVNSLERGIIEVVDGPADIIEALQFETKSVREAREAEAQRHTSMLDRRQDRDIVGLKCIGPAPQGRTGECGVAIIQSAKQQADTPPLCSNHQHLTPQFYLAEAGSKGEGATENSDGVVRREWRQAELVKSRTL